MEQFLDEINGIPLNRLIPKSPFFRFSAIFFGGVFLATCFCLAADYIWDRTLMNKILLDSLPLDIDIHTF